MDEQREAEKSGKHEPHGVHAWRHAQQLAAVTHLARGIRGAESTSPTYQGMQSRWQSFHPALAPVAQHSAANHTVMPTHQQKNSDSNRARRKCGAYKVASNVVQRLLPWPRTPLVPLPLQRRATAVVVQYKVVLCDQQAHAPIITDTAAAAENQQ